MSASKSRKSSAPSGRATSSRSPLFDEDIAFQQRQWRVERLGWAGMVAVIIGALVGVFGGGGLLDRATASDSAGSSEVEYARFARYSSPTTVAVKSTPLAGGRPLRIRISDRYLSEMNLRGITPPPTSTSVTDRQHVFIFERSALPATATIRFELEPTTIGQRHGWIAVDEGAPLYFTHFIYP